MTKLVLHTLPPSPFNTKVRLALSFKGLDYDTVEVHGFDGREAIVEATGQPLTPVIVDGDRKVFDSFAILRYLDANFDGPRLYSNTREGMREIERWEDLSRNGYGPALGLMLNMVISGEQNADTITLVNKLFDQLTVRVEQALEKNAFLTGDAITAADLAIAPFIHFASSDPESSPEKSLGRAVSTVLHLGARHARTRAWVERVMAYDRTASAV
ncbi:Glutathione S-transferase GstB [Planctomycetes bacterium Pla163]|uniref:Glutathione S-transferase GstB n=1 Tax=Rohdeia mirabilis TaxID=2528008 RepID=A0A518CUU9_9BACT|nr:Glutathione S-transferase GstB [Planctomycetes bacterium Pla163]